MTLRRINIVLQAQRKRVSSLPHASLSISASHGHFDSPLQLAGSGQHHSFGVNPHISSTRVCLTKSAQGTHDHSVSEPAEDASGNRTDEPVKRKRGRPKNVAQARPGKVTHESKLREETTPKRTRGRPRKPIANIRWNPWLGFSAPGLVKPNSLWNREEHFIRWNPWIGYTSLHLVAPPPPVQGWPTPLILQAEIDAYFPPLYARGWFVDYFGHPKRTHGEDRNERVNLTRYAALAATFRFRSDEFDVLAKRFEGLIASLEKFENHHIEKLRDQTQSILTVVSHTHSAVLLPSTPSTLSSSASADANSDKRDPKATGSAADEGKGTGKDKDKIKGTRMPGITLRDVRFALLLEARIGEQFYCEDEEEGLEKVIRGDGVQKRPMHVGELVRLHA